MIILAVDLGLVRTGLAVCDKDEVLASPLAVITQRDPQRLCTQIADYVQQRGAQRIVVGLPRNMDSTEGESARRAREFGAALQQQSGVQVDFCDERGTSITAHGYLNETNTRGKKRKAVIDAVAATIILEDYLNYRRMHGQTP